MKKVYIAGPDVFKSNAKELGEEYKRVLSKLGFEPLFPLDNDVSDCKPNLLSYAIYSMNRDMIDNADIVIADLNPFRGAEPDSGTVWEVGYACGIGKPVIGHVWSLNNDYKANVKWYRQLLSSECMEDTYEVVEDFGGSFNLMIQNSITVVFGDFITAAGYVHDFHS